MVTKLTAAQVEAHRLRNREGMRRTRQNQRQQLLEMKTTLHQLEKRYAELSHRSYTRDNGNCRITKAVSASKRLGAEKLLLQCLLQQKAAWILQLQRIVDFEATDIFSEPQIQEAPKVAVEIIDEHQAAQEFGFQPLTEQDLTQSILDNKRRINHVESRLLRSTLDISSEHSRTNRMQAFGWDIVQRVDGGIMEFVYTKSFHALDILNVMQKTWTNGMTLEEFKKVKAETYRLQALQRINSNAYVFTRDVFSPSNISTFRSVFVRFLVEATKEVSLNTPESKHTVIGTGYVLGTQSVTINCPLAENADGRLAWAELALAIEAFDVVNPNTAETYKHIRWLGRTDYCSEEHAQRNASDTLQGMLRWEMQVIAPALNLVTSTKST
ncbi:unnamed protein product [Phytophthora fragariaefolia]|uniref:Unnamed protein product n=1 Tax=Phytophthora fragariaefolia TaxID=1490495 RepID=A0A9W6Y445_9STRA|nr:unnamed protein product [Phytophthora fragariaefolia]